LLDPDVRDIYAGAAKIAGGQAKAAANAAARKATPVTKAMRDKVRNWAIARASKARGEIQTEGVAMAAARAALNGDSAIGAIPKAAAARGWRDIPDNSVFSTRTGSYTGRDIKSLVREAVTAGKNHVANAPQLEAFTGPRYADKARSAVAGAKVARKAPSKRALKAARERIGRPKK
jgi:hypothetical protein